jgi:hypothetical protein
MQEEPVHYYNVILGKCACGAKPDPARKSFSVFPKNVNCPECLAALEKASGNSEVASG